MKEHVNSARNLIEKEVKADTRKLMSNDAFENATNQGKPAAGSLREFAEKRSEYLLNHPAIKDLPETTANSTEKKESK